MTTAEQYGMISPVGTDEIADGDDAISINAAATAAALDSLRGDLWPRPGLLRDADFNAVTTTGPYSVGQAPTSAATATAANMPYNGMGILEVFPVGSARIQRFTTYTTPPRVFVRYSGSTGVTPVTWGQWFETTAPDLYLTLNPGLPVNPDFDTILKYGTHHIAANPTLPYADLHWPTASRGALTVSKIGSSYLQTYLTYDVVPQLWARRSSGAVFTAWARLDAGAVVIPPAAPASTGRAGSGMKRVGVPITAGHSGSDAPVESSVRMPLLYGAPVTRWRLRIQDINPRSGVTRAGAINLTGIWFGQHAGAGAMTGKQQLLGAVTIPDGATEYRSPWFNTPMNAGTEYLLSFGYTKSTAPWAMLGYSYQTATAADAAADNPAGMVKKGTAPFSIAIEAETYAHTPVIASLGDSNSVGVGAVNGLHDSWLSQLCRRVKALPDHRGSSGDTCENSLTGTGYKYTRFSDLTRPDAVLLAMGQNDAAAPDVTAATITPKIATVLGNLAAVADTVYAVTYMPRTANPWAGFEDVRRALNTYLLTQPAGVRDVFDIGAAISTDDDTITPAYDADGTHLNAAGFAQVQAAINRPVTTPPVQYAP